MDEDRQKRLDQYEEGLRKYLFARGGGAVEMFWKAGFPGLQLRTDLPVAQVEIVDPPDEPTVVEPKE